MNFFEFVGDKEPNFDGMTWADASAMFEEGADMSESSMEVHLDNLAEFEAAMVHSGAPLETIMELARLETEVFRAIWQFANLYATHRVAKALELKLAEWALEAEQGKKEGA